MYKLTKLWKTVLNHTSLFQYISYCHINYMALHFLFIESMFWKYMHKYIYTHDLELFSKIQRYSYNVVTIFLVTAQLESIYLYYIDGYHHSRQVTHYHNSKLVTAVLYLWQADGIVKELTSKAEWYIIKPYCPNSKIGNSTQIYGRTNTTKL